MFASVGSNGEGILRLATSGIDSDGFIFLGSYKNLTQHCYNDVWTSRNKPRAKARFNAPADGVSVQVLTPVALHVSNVYAVICGSWVRQNDPHADSPVIRASCQISSRREMWKKWYISYSKLSNKRLEATRVADLRGSRSFKPMRRRPSLVHV